LKKIDLVTFAKNLYFEMDEAGNQKYSLREIETKIKNETKKKVSYVTLSRWVKKLGWDKTFQDAKNLGIYKAVTDSQIDEHKIIQAKAEEQSKHYKALDHVFKIGYDEIVRRAKEDPESLKQVRAGELLDFMVKSLDRLKGFFGNEEKSDLIIEVKRKKADE